MTINGVEYICTPKCASKQSEQPQEQPKMFVIENMPLTDFDLKKEYDDYVGSDPVIKRLVNGVAGNIIAKHFFELGLKAQTK